MDEALLLISRALLLAVGAGGAVTLIIAAVRRRLGWLPAVAGAAILLEFPAMAWLVGADSPPLLLGITSVPWFLGFPILAATFPDGRFVPRWGVWVIVASLAIVALDAATGFALRLHPLWAVVSVLQLVTGILFIAIRYRGSTSTTERTAVRWVLLGVLVTLASFMLIQVVDGIIGGGTAQSDAKASLALLPLMLGLVIGAASPGAWNVDVAFRAVLVVLGAGWVLGGVYAAVTAVVQAFAPDAATSWAAAGVAIAAYPVVKVAARLSTWLVYRDRLDPSSAAARLAAALEADDARGIARRVVDVAAEATGSPGVQLSASNAADDEVFSASRIEPGVPSVGDVTFPVVFRGELLARLSARPRAGQSELSARDRSALAAIAQQSAPSLHDARTLREATSAQAALVTAREEERRALRRELHDDIGPALSGLALSAAAIARRADEVSPGLAADARELQTDIAGAVERARAISHGLRPPVLDDHGLEAALRDRVDGDVVMSIGELGELPAAVDLAALRIVQEAVTNVRRHAAASVCSVRVDRATDGLTVEVIDDGIGIPQDVAPGLGLRSIRERAAEVGGRAHISRISTGGTVVSVWLPIRETP